jgi:hypothetical protein
MYRNFAVDKFIVRLTGIRFRVSALPPAKKTNGLIEKETEA